MRLYAALTLVVGCSLWSASPAAARPFRVGQIPNGSINGCANCHINPAGGGARNAFGTMIETSFLSPPGATGNVQWGPALAGLDADGDGFGNGLELQDPFGVWISMTAPPGNPAAVTLPGSASSHPPTVPAFSRGQELLLACALIALGLSGARLATRAQRQRS